MAGPARPTTKTSTMVRRGLCRHCPVCGGGRVFHRWFVMADACPTCGLHFKRSPGQWLGSWFLNIVTVQVVVFALLVAAVITTWPQTPSAWLVGLAVGAAVVVPLVLFPFSRTLWTAIDLTLRPLHFDDGVAPGVFLEADRAALAQAEGWPEASGEAP